MACALNSVILASIRNKGAIALGHPLGMSGAHCHVRDRTTARHRRALPARLHVRRRRTGRRGTTGEGQTTRGGRNAPSLNPSPCCSDGIEVRSTTEVRADIAMPLVDVQLSIQKNSVRGIAHGVETQKIEISVGKFWICRLSSNSFVSATYFASKENRDCSLAYHSDSLSSARPPCERLRTWHGCLCDCF